VSDYATIDDVKEYIKGEDQRSGNDTRIAAALSVSSRLIDRYCGRSFSADAVASSRLFWADARLLVVADDFWTTDGLVVATDTSDDGTADTTWTASEYLLEPLNGIVDGVAGFPYYRLRATMGRTFPVAGRRPRVHITAKWGWAAVPEPVRQACLHLTSTIYKMEDAPFGIAALNDFGPLRMSPDLTRHVASMLDPYVRAGVVYGVG
jgi:hypothetical protein